VSRRSGLQTAVLVTSPAELLVTAFRRSRERGSFDAGPRLYFASDCRIIPAIKTSPPNREGRGKHKPQTLETDARLGRIVRVLMSYPTLVISGTKLAQEIGTTRSEVWRLVQQLRTLGVEIAGHPASGYQLKAVPDLVLPEMLAALVRGTIFCDHIHHYYRAGSTNNVALEAAAGGAPEGSVFLAEQQTAGRGRGGNQWHSAESTGIYCSVVLRPALPPADVLVLSLAVGLAVHWAVQDVNPQLIPDLKWPNDLLINGRKFCGILTEMSAEATRVRHIVVGIGINVNQTRFPDDLQQTATSLRLATGSEWSRVELCAALLKSLDREYRELAKADAAEEILSRFAQRSSSVRGKHVRIDENGGFEGVTEGLDPRGFLKVRTREGVRVVYSGTVRLVASS
jgi:BirA family transcriptional regulator, biotin operon repressor / biotin---[acetyl-CoA-carboxylase] ligase